MLSMRPAGNSCYGRKRQRERSDVHRSKWHSTAGGLRELMWLKESTLGVWSKVKQEKGQGQLWKPLEAGTSVETTAEHHT
jgi:hypothetical protein